MIFIINFYKIILNIFYKLQTTVFDIITVSSEVMRTMLLHSQHFMFLPINQKVVYFYGE